MSVSDKCDTCSFTACLWLSGGVPSGVPSLQFGHCCVRTDCRCVALDLSIFPLCPTSILVPTVVVVVSPTVARGAQVHSLEEVCGGVLAAQLSSMALCVVWLQ